MFTVLAIALLIAFSTWIRYFSPSNLTIPTGQRIDFPYLGQDVRFIVLLLGGILFMLGVIADKIK